MRDMPPELDVPEFHIAWRAWEAHRRERKPKLTPTSVSRQIAMLSRLGVERAIKAIEHSITMGWQGIFEYRGDARNGKPELHAGLKAFLEDKE